MATFRPGPGKGSVIGGRANVRIKGLASLKKDFVRISNKSDSIMTKEIHRAAERIAERANRDVPVDTGALNKSIGVTKRNKYAEVNVTEKYAGYVEGTVSSRSEPQPFFFKHVEPSINVLMDNIKRLITFK